MTKPPFSRCSAEFCIVTEQRNIIDKTTALNWIDKISDFISEDEYSIVKMLLEKNYEG